MFVEKERQIPVYGSYDTVVVGGGFAGVSAALAASRGGNKVLLCEREFMLGGLGTAGLVTIYLPLCDGMGHQVSYGIAEELFKLSISQGWEAEYPSAWLENGSFEEKCAKRYRVRYNAAMCAILFEKKLLEEGVELLYGTAVCDAAVSGGRITHLIVENKSGRSAIEVQNVIDCSGDADVCKFCGENTALFGQGNVLAGWYYFLEEGKFNLQMVGASDIPDEEKDAARKQRDLNKKRYSGLDATELTAQMIDSHNATYSHFLQKGSISDGHMLTTIASIPQIRMTRRLDGEFVMDTSHERKYFADSVGLFSNWRKRGPVYELPYSVLHGSKIKNLAVAGRCISVTDALWDITRVIPVCAVTGEAVGTAAALGRDFDSVNIAVLQQTLRNNGVKLHTEEIME